MHKILLISDTHGNYNLIENILIKNINCNTVIHLGDEPDDLEGFPDLLDGKILHSVYGIYHSGWSIKNAVREFTVKYKSQELSFCIAHVKEHLPNHSDYLKRIYCFGHTHHRFFETKENSVFINPGHLKKNHDRGEDAGYAIILFDDVNSMPYIEICFFDYKHSLIEKCSM